MKYFWKEFFKRGSSMAFVGPVIMAIVYLCIDSAELLAANEVSLGIITSTIMAFIAAGITAIYTVEKLPVIKAVLLHGIVLYADYLALYLINDWMEQSLTTIAVFTGIFVVGYALIWGFIYFMTRKRTEKINQQLKSL